MHFSDLGKQIPLGIFMEKLIINTTIFESCNLQEICQKSGTILRNGKPSFFQHQETKTIENFI